MAYVIPIPPDPATLDGLLKLLIREKPVNMGADSEKMYGLVRDEHNNLRIPFGLAKSLWNVQSHQLHQLPRKAIQTTIELGSGGREYQIATYNALCDLMLKQHVAYLSLYCGAGKTIIASKLICDMGIKAAVITETALIFPQWLHVFRTQTNAVVHGIASPVEQLPEGDVYIIMAEAARKMHPSILAGIQLLVVDEALYFMTTNRIPSMLNFTPSYVLGLCAEVKRDDGMHCFLPYFFGHNMIRRISQKPFTVFRIETNYKPIVSYARYSGKVDWNTVLDSISENEERNNDIVYLCQTQPDSKIIIGTKRKEQARELYRKLKEAGENVALLIENMKTIPQCRILVGIYSKMGKGVDVKNLCPLWEGEVFDACILAADNCKPEQFVGRVFRHDNPVVYDFVDDYSTFRSHFTKKRLPWYKSRKGTIVNTVINRPK